MAPDKKKIELKKHAADIVKGLKKLYPDVHCALIHANPFELLVSTILSAQCTDKQVNKVTPALFQRFPNPKSFAEADLSEIEKYVQSTGFYKNKAKNIKACSEMLLARHNGEVPKTLDELTELPGVGRKTANVVLGVAYGLAGFVVDTHVGRLTRRMGLTKNTDAVKVEFDIMELVPAKEWNDFGLRLIQHGRQICDARKPKCEICGLNKICPKII